MPLAAGAGDHHTEILGIEMLAQIRFQVLPDRQHFQAPVQEGGGGILSRQSPGAAGQFLVADPGLIEPADEIGGFLQHGLTRSVCRLRSPGLPLRRLQESLPFHPVEG